MDGKWEMGVDRGWTLIRILALVWEGWEVFIYSQGSKRRVITIVNVYRRIQAVSYIPSYWLISHCMLSGFMGSR